jgi:hypothetical protein
VLSPLPSFCFFHRGESTVFLKRKLREKKEIKKWRLKKIVESTGFPMKLREKPPLHGR